MAKAKAEAKDKIGVVQLEKILWQLLSILTGAGGDMALLIRMRQELAADLGILDPASKPKKKRSGG